MTRLRAWLAPLLLIWSSGALAAQNAFVHGKNVSLRAGPSKDSDVVGSLADGESVQISNYPTQGYYKVRSSSGQIGWVDSSAVSGEAAPASQPAPSAPSGGAPQGGQIEELPPPPGEQGAAAAPATSEPSAPTPTMAPAPVARPAQSGGAAISYEDVPEGEHRRGEGETEGARKKKRPPIEAKVFGGIQKVSLSDVNHQFGGTVMSIVPYFGAQGGYPLEEKIYLLLRLERFQGSSSFEGANFSLGATSITAGLQYIFERDKDWSFSVSALLGVSPANTLDVSSTSLPPSAVTHLSGTAFTEIIKFDLGIPVENWLEIYGEAGYRFLNSESVGTSLSGNGSTVTSSATNTPVSIDLSGPFFGLGVTFLF